MKRKKRPLLFLVSSVLLLCQIPYPANSAEGSSSLSGFLRISPAMKELLDKEILPVRGEKRRLDKIVELIFNRSVVGFDYSSVKTYSAEETFRKRKGNCLSYTAMFIAMARYAGLNARFQEVSDFSDWSRKGEIVVFSSHMNSIVIIGTKYYEVDFQYRSEKKFWNRKVIKDNRAEAHYYNNTGSEALLRGEWEVAEKLLKKSIDLDPTFSFAWTNLGVLLKKKGNPEEAELCLRKAVKLDRHNHTAKLNLAALLDESGSHEEASRLRKEIRKIQNTNPYYHFNLGMAAYDSGRFREAAAQFKNALKRDRHQSEFYIRLSAAYYKLGKFKLSEKYLKRGRKFAETDREKDKYRKKLEYIYIKLREDN